MLKKCFLFLFVMILIVSLSFIGCRRPEPFSEQDYSSILSEDFAQTDSASEAGNDVSSSREGVESIPQIASVGGGFSITSSDVVSNSSTQEVVSQFIAPESKESTNESTNSTNSSVLHSTSVSRTDAAQRFIDWTKNANEIAPENEVHFQKAKEKGTLLIPYSTRSDLKNGNSLLPTINMETGGAHWSFCTNDSDVLLENEYYKIYILPLTATEIKKDIKDYFYPNEKNKKLGTYRGVQYAYFDGYEGKDRLDSADTAAWFIRDGYLIRITALYVNNYKPWNDKWFDYFNFENVTL